MTLCEDLEKIASVDDLLHNNALGQHSRKVLARDQQQQQQPQGAAGSQPTEAKEGEEKGKQPRKAKRKRKARDLRAHLVAKGEPPENLPMG